MLWLIGNEVFLQERGSALHRLILSPFFFFFLSFMRLLFSISVQEVADNNCVYRNEIHHSVGERTQVLQDVTADPTLPRTKAVRCTQCNHGEAVFFQVEFLFDLNFFGYCW